MKILDALKSLRQSPDEFSGGCHTMPEVRMLLFTIAKMMEAKIVVETGYDAGMTTYILGLTGAEVWAVDNYSEYPGIKKIAQERVKGIKARLFREDALDFLETKFSGNTVQFIFIDDNHHIGHVKQEIGIVKRILAPGGIAVFHDVFFFRELGKLVKEEFADWNVIFLPSYNDGEDRYKKVNYGVAIVQKPYSSRDESKFFGIPE